MQLNQDNPAGWYLCSYCIDPREQAVRYWDGSILKLSPTDTVPCRSSYLVIAKMEAVTLLENENKPSSP